jgi:hypothetical protein
MSKSLDMRLHWVCDRVKQGQFVVQHLPGLQNIADFFTKALPVVRHKDLAPFLALDDDQTIDDIVHAKLKLSALLLLFAACILTPASSGCVDTSVAYVYRYVLTLVDKPTPVQQEKQDGRIVGWPSP